MILIPVFETSITSKDEERFHDILEIEELNRIIRERIDKEEGFGAKLKEYLKARFKIG